MKTIGYFAGALALGGGLAAAGESAAAIYVDNTFVSAGDTGNIYLPGSSSLNYAKDGVLGDATISGSSGVGFGSFTDASTLPTAGTTFATPSVDVAAFPYVSGSWALNDPADPYLPFSYVDDSRTLDGVVAFDGTADLVSTTYLTSVTEPEAWALLIAGAGMAGAALRVRRRTASAAA